MERTVQITVYGAEQICASCVNLPGSRETFEWIQAAISRKFGEEGIMYQYIDIFSPPEDDQHQKFARRVIEEDLFYPVVLVDDEIVGEGNPKLKAIYRALEEKGFEPVA